MENIVETFVNLYRRDVNRDVLYYSMIDIFCKLVVLKLLIYEGQADFIDLEKWIRDIDKFLDVTGCLEV